MAPTLLSSLPFSSTIDVLYKHHRTYCVNITNVSYSCESLRQSSADPWVLPNPTRGFTLCLCQVAAFPSTHSVQTQFDRSLALSHSSILKINERPIGMVLRHPRRVSALPHRVVFDHDSVCIGPRVALLALFQLPPHLHERTRSFRGRTADFVYMLLLGAGAMILVAPFVSIHFLGSSLTFMMVYIWGRRNEHRRICRGCSSRSRFYLETARLRI
uniref:Derlin n=1 Tax=Hyaloperonospora arabidopsidis (strain Emoy2) TaxID=559515 RepID=M4BUY4_HYAAE